MPACLAPPPVAQKVDLAAYLAKKGGRDVLTFETPEIASNAAWKLREQDHPGLQISASYNRVYLVLVKS